MSPSPEPREQSTISIEMLIGLQRDVGNHVVAQLMARARPTAPASRQDGGADHAEPMATGADREPPEP